MGAIEFLCDIRFHHSFLLAANPETGRSKPLRVSYADYGDSNSDAVVLFCGALMGTRFCYSPLDRVAKAHNVRIIHPDRPGIGGTEAVEQNQRIPTWLEMIPPLLAHLNITHVSLASHSGGIIYALNALLTYPHMLHPKTPYVAFFAPWVHHSHSRIHHLRATELLPAPLIGRFASMARFVNDNVVPLAGLSSTFFHGIKDAFHYSMPAPAPVPLAPTPSSLSRTVSRTSTDGGDEGLDLDDPEVVEEMRQLIIEYLFAEAIEGIGADAKLFLKKPSTIQWCSPSIFWSDVDYLVPLLAKIIEGEKTSQESDRRWTIDAFHAQTDDMVGEKGRLWFDECWKSYHVTAPISPPSEPGVQERKSLEFRSEVVPNSEHNYLMDPAYGACDKWLERVKESFPVPEEV
ncbi:hypothetical protein P154DRAFT_480679 [Amniculicola lignicola CBS 123094]|uniref:AB hydrolase-1 domain-containing protein n=1 Tax=Amniculicola lignicola CBS 123094 TaxID=1392246 RepID=A0A6A5X1I4_9PLEO|nr:hypothetical protein P154DRAFT_480679 [Amniculicola lignicola CBS 123094]